MEHPDTFQSRIFKRAFTEKEFESLCDSYNRAKLISRNTSPTDLQMKIAEFAKKHSIHEAAKKFKINNQKVTYCLEKVGRHYYINS